MRQISLDTETTGLDPKSGHRVIEIGGVELVNRRITGNNFHAYINPERAIDAGALAVHGISTEFLTDKPLFADILPGFLEYISGAELIIHNAPFDVGFLNHEFLLVDKRSAKIAEICQVFDTLKHAREIHPGQKNNLDALCKRYGIDNSHRDLHGALLDAEILALVYLHMTGGQSSLFGESTTKSQQAHQPVKNIEHNYNLRVLKASDEELAAHTDYVTMLNEKTDGKALWGKEDK